jgi:hypothetical protein
MTTPAPPAEDHFVEVVETETGTVVECLGPMTENKADRVDSGLQINMNHERYHTRTGTRAALDKEAADWKAANTDPAGAVAAKLGLKAAPGYEAELQDGQGLAALAVAAHDAEQPIGAAGAKRLHRDLSPAVMAEARRRSHEEITENAAAEVLAAALEYGAAPRSAPRLRRLRSAASKYATLRGARRPAPTKRKKGARK